MEVSKSYGEDENKGLKNTRKGSEGSIQSCQLVRGPNNLILIVWEGILAGEGRELPTMQNTPFFGSL